MDSFDREQYLQQLREYYSGDRDRIDQFLEDMSDSLDCYLKEPRLRMHQRSMHVSEIQRNLRSSRSWCAAKVTPNGKEM